MAPSNKKIDIRILHVDDDPSIREISKQILMDMGSFEIDGACCVDEAFKKLAIGNYDVAISDYELPQKDGLQYSTNSSGLRAAATASSLRLYSKMPLAIRRTTI